LKLGRLLSKFFLFVLALGLFPPFGPLADATAPPLPVKVPDVSWRPLLQHTDKALQSRLRQQLRSRPEWQRLLGERKMAVGLVDLSNPAAPRFAHLNGNQEMYAASLPKIAILLAAFDQFEHGTLKRSPEVEQDLNDMIRVSSNAAATRMIDRIGGLMRVNQVLRDPRYGFYDAEDNGGLWVGKRYAKQGPRLPDPLHGISHAATVTQVCRFYYQLATGRLISPAASADMLAMLSEPAIGHKFVKSLRELAPQADLYRKSGTWQRWHADSVLVWGPEWRRYILVALVESPRGERVLRELVAVAEKVLRPRRG
jgi:beta-lactamase class A